MTDLRTLTDAFDELARRGDAAAAAMPAGLPTRSPARSVRRAVPITVAAAVVGLATTTAVLAAGDETGREEVLTAPMTTTTTTTTSPIVQPWTPRTADELADRFRAVLGDRATFVVTETNGAAIGGTITRAGVTGGFHLQIYVDSSRTPWCAEPATCTETTLPDGSRMAASTSSLEGGGSAHQVVLLRPGNVLTIMDLSNQRSPKGQSDLLAAEPPLTLDEMIAIVTDSGW